VNRLKAVLSRRGRLLEREIAEQAAGVTGKTTSSRLARIIRR
jgi:hypothetical protein